MPEFQLVGDMKKQNDYTCTTALKNKLELLSKIKHNHSSNIDSTLIYDIYSIICAWRYNVQNI